MAKTQDARETESPTAQPPGCERCGAPIEIHPGFPKICDDCYTLYGSCCNEWEDGPAGVD